MTQKDKDLLLNDLCARLPYNPMVEYKGETYNVLGITHGRLVLCKPFMSYTLDENPLVKEVKPYLFPLSSMTEEQLLELTSISFENSIDSSIKTLDWCYRNNYDVNNLIPIGLANDATGLNIY